MLKKRIGKKIEKLCCAEFEKLYILQSLKAIID